ncbi:MAG: type III pantothenate kinase [Coriobacteriia bacterium]|nr:type III pantothenate kinase [Coriobacteriia bacterium]
MLLTIDVGNTFTNLALFDQEMVKSWNVSSMSEIDLGSIDNLDAIALSCVVADAETKIKDKASKLNVDFFSLNSNTVPKNLFKTKYPNASEIGADFIAGAVGGIKKYGCPCVVFDLGTATNVDIVDKCGFFIGGIIAPGLQTSLNALIGKASALSDIELKSPESVIGKSTDEAIRSGIVVGEASKIDGLIDRIENELGYKVNVITTGGWADLVTSHMKHKAHYDKYLILDSLKYIYEQVRQN